VVLDSPEVKKINTFLVFLKSDTDDINNMQDIYNVKLFSLASAPLSFQKYK